MIPRWLRVSLALFTTGMFFECIAGEAIKVQGVGIYGMDSETAFPVIVRDTVTREGQPVLVDSYITIQFDVLAQHPPPLKIRFLHCNRNWVPDDNYFVQDENFNTSFYLQYRTAPGGVEGYKYRYINRFPDPDGVVRFTHSGNWVYRIMDKDESVVYWEGRFFVVDNFVPSTMTVGNDFLTARESPLNQVHRVTVGVKLADEAEGLFHTTVDVYQNRRFYSPFRIDAYDRNPHTVVEGFGSGTRTFTIRNIHPGNEYRALDLSNTTQYPNRALVRLVEGVDLQRRFLRAAPDRNGIPLLNTFTGIHSDYLDVLFRLRLTDTERMAITGADKEIFLAGPFNDWLPFKDDRLEYSGREDAFVVTKTLRRGIYDYQYITGCWDDEREEVVDQDWVELEGNDWRTSSIYSAFIYYNDPRYGGFDRIVGYATSASSAGTPGSQ